MIWPEPLEPGERQHDGEHAVNVVRFGFRPHHDDRLAVLFSPRFRQVGVEGHDAAGRLTGQEVIRQDEILIKRDYRYDAIRY